MLPTFRPGQLLYSRPVEKDIKPGDVVAFEGLYKKRVTVHRVVRKSGTGWITRGDNNNRFDPEPVKIDQIIGRVEMIESNNQLKFVRRGVFAIFKARFRWWRKGLKKKVPGFLRNFYQLIRRSNFIYRILNTFLSKNLKIIRLNMPYGTLIKTTYRGKTVAQWIEGKKDYYCQKPFDVIIQREVEKQIRKS